MKKIILLIILLISAPTEAGWDIVKKNREYFKNYIKVYKIDNRCPVCNHIMPRPESGKPLLRIGYQGIVEGFVCICEECGAVFILPMRESQ